MEEIAAEAGTSKTVVYRHFADRAELYVAVCNRVASQLLPQAAERDRGRQRHPRADGRRGDRHLSGVHRGRPRALPVRRPPADARPAGQRPDRQPVRPRRRSRRRPRSRWPCTQAGSRSGGRRAVGPRRRRAGPLGRRLVASRRAPHAPHGTRSSPDRSRLGRPVRRRDPRIPDQHGGNSDQHSCPTSVDPKAIQEVLDGRWAHVRRDARENLDDPDFLPVYGETVPGGPRAGDPRGQEAGRLRPGRLRLPEGVRRRGRLRRLGHLDRDARVRRPLADGQGRRPVGPVRRRPAAARHQAPARQVPARRHELRPARLLRDDRDRARLRRPAAADDVHLRPGDRRPSTCTPRTRPPARTTSATRPRTAGWRSSSRS